MLKSLLLAFTLVLAVLNAGCKKAPTQISRLDSEQREQYLNQLQHWQFEGRLGIREQNQGQNVSIEWRQNGPEFDMYIYSPLSTQSARVLGKPTQASLTTADGEVFMSASPDQLILEHLGWHLPFANLCYWIRGLPAPEISSSGEKYDRFNQLQSMEQDGWQIHYASYQVVPPVSLPTKISMTKDNIKIKIVIKSWQL